MTVSGWLVKGSDSNGWILMSQLHVKHLPIFYTAKYLWYLHIVNLFHHVLISHLFISWADFGSTNVLIIILSLFNTPWLREPKVAIFGYKMLLEAIIWKKLIFYITKVDIDSELGYIWLVSRKIFTILIPDIKIIFKSKILRKKTCLWCWGI